MFVEEHDEMKFETNKGRDEFVEEILEVLDRKVTIDELNEVSDLLDCPHYKQK